MSLSPSTETSLNSSGNLKKSASLEKVKKMASYGSIDIDNSFSTYCSFVSSDDSCSYFSLLKFSFSSGESNGDVVFTNGFAVLSSLLTLYFEVPISLSRTPFVSFSLSSDCLLSKGNFRFSFCLDGAKVVEFAHSKDNNVDLSSKKLTMMLVN